MPSNRSVAVFLTTLPAVHLEALRAACQLHSLYPALGRPGQCHKNKLLSRIMESVMESYGIHVPSKIFIDLPHAFFKVMCAFFIQLREETTQSKTMRHPKAPPTPPRPAMVPWDCLRLETLEIAISVQPFVFICSWLILSLSSAGEML